MIYIVGEDVVTKAVILRLLSHCDLHPDVEERPARGGEIKQKIPAFNALSRSYPVVLLTDLDACDCAPKLKNQLLGGQTCNTNFIINIAVDEAEAWLMADRHNFASYFKIPLQSIPQAQPKKQGGRKALIEMDFPVKSSFLLTHSLALQSTDADVRQKVGRTDRNCKGREYNSSLLPFIRQHWDVDEARKNSDSLDRMIKRIERHADVLK